MTWDSSAKVCWRLLSPTWKKHGAEGGWLEPLNQRFFWKQLNKLTHYLVLVNLRKQMSIFSPRFLASKIRSPQDSEKRKEMRIIHMFIPKFCRWRHYSLPFLVSSSKFSQLTAQVMSLFKWVSLGTWQKSGKNMETPCGGPCACACACACACCCCCCCCCHCWWCCWWWWRLWWWRCCWRWLDSTRFWLEKDLTEIDYIKQL